MGMTITEKILALHTGLDRVEPGQLIMANVDLALGNDVTAPIAIDEFKRHGGKDVFDKSKVVLVPDHFAPNKDIKSAVQCKILRDFAREKGIENYFEVGNMGIEHALLPESGLVAPGDLIIGADSHTCTYGAVGAFSTGVGSTDLAAAMMSGRAWFKVPETIKFVYHGTLKGWVYGKDVILYTIGKIGVDGALYKSMEFTGGIIDRMNMSERFTMCNMVIEAGGKNGIIIPDKTTISYVNDRVKRPYTVFISDKDAKYENVIEYELSNLKPQVAFPHLPENTKPIDEVGRIEIDQAFVGSCTNGWIEDLRIAANIIKGKKVNSNLRMIVIPATREIYKQALKEGLIDSFVEAGAVFSTPTCGPCLGGHMGVLAPGERAIATTNRNFKGRMGDLDSEVYLANPAIVAASAVLGRIGSPEELGMKGNG
ncbi:MAG: 3-isopropylmalate dehydratase large subunit [Deltaproteobacteria bacterium]|nr:3-isopropylmalate dehydratase large subunit [Deltaproteobacteria bacterium]MCL5792385.1 3-isopropylmalate dehydratase large subunit [Deltaproteobacteria bacterium]